MSLKHLPSKHLRNTKNKSHHSKREKDIRQHLISHEEDQLRQHDYQLIISEIKRVKAFEPDEKFVNRVTANLPDKYAKKEKPVFEILSLLVIFIPVGFVTAFLLSSNQLKFSSLKQTFTPLSSIVNSLLNSLTSFRFIHENMNVFGLFLIYALVFSILDRLFLYRKEVRKN